jgi:hypothetical protein
VLVPQYGQQLEALNAKLDKILGFLNEIRAEQVLTTKEPIAEPVVIVDPKTEELSVTKSSASRIKKVTKKASRK